MFQPYLNYYSYLFILNFSLFDKSISAINYLLLFEIVCTFSWIALEPKQWSTLSESCWFPEMQHEKPH